MHKIAAENPKAVITFNFYDDSKSILRCLGEFFKNNPDLIPPNITLNLHWYNGDPYEKEQPILLDSISASPNSRIDRQFENSIKEIIKLNGIELTDTDVYHNKYDLIEDLDVGKFRNCRQIEIHEVSPAINILEGTGSQLGVFVQSGSDTHKEILGQQDILLPSRPTSC